jgi:hypothetical protein
VIGWLFALRSLIPDAFHTPIWTVARLSIGIIVHTIVRQHLALQPGGLGARRHG